MNKIKIDAAPLIYAVKGNYISLLQKLYDKILILDSVYEEVVIQGKKRGRRDAYVIEKYIEDKILIKESDEPNPPRYLLGKGEISVIHAAKIEDCAALLDDHKARKISIQNNVETKWSMLLFLEALQLKKIDEEGFHRLMNQYIRLASPSVIEYQIVLEMKKLVI